MSTNQRPQKFTQNAAQTAAFQTLEILELILNNLSFPDLATCQNINQYFSATIQNSSFLRPKVSHEIVRTQTLRYIPTSGGAFGFVLGPEITERKLCPLLSFEGQEPTWRGPPDCFPKVAAKFTIGRFFAEEASWGDVYLTNPPVAEAWISISWRIDSDEFEGGYSESRRIESEDGEGLTVRKLHEGLLRQRRWTAACGASRKGVTCRYGGYLCAREETVAGSLKKLEEVTGCKAEVVKGCCSVYFPRMVGAVRRGV